MRTDAVEDGKIEVNQIKRRRDVGSIRRHDRQQREGAGDMGDSNPSPQTFSFTTNTHLGRVDAYPWAPTFIIEKSWGQTEWHVHRCPYCAHHHKFSLPPGTRVPRIYSYSSACVPKTEGHLAARCMPIDRRPSDAELDEFFPLVEYGVGQEGAIGRKCFQFHRNELGFIQIVNELHESWLPGGELHAQLVRGNTILPHDCHGAVIRPSVRQPIPRELRAAVWQKTFGRCYLCGALPNPFDDLHIDHLQPVADGGTNDLVNLWPACATCNQQKHAMSLEAFRSRRGGGLFWFEVARMGGAS